MLFEWDSNIIHPHKIILNTVLAWILLMFRNIKIVVHSWQKFHVFVFKSTIFLFIATILILQYCMLIGSLEKKSLLNFKCSCCKNPLRVLYSEKIFTRQQNLYFFTTTNDYYYLCVLVFNIPGNAKPLSIWSYGWCITS